MKTTILAFASLIITSVFAQQKVNGLDNNLSNFYRLSDARTGSISPEILMEKRKGGAVTNGITCAVFSTAR